MYFKNVLTQFCYKDSLIIGYVCVYLFFIAEFLFMMLTAFMPFFPLSS